MMKGKAEKTRDEHDQSTARSVHQVNIRNAPMPGFLDNRSKTVAQRELIQSINNRPTVQRKIYIGRGAKDPIAEDGDIANELRAEAKPPAVPVFFPHMILEPAITEWENPVRVERKEEVIPSLQTWIPAGDDLKGSFKKGDKLYGMEKARKGHTNPRGGGGLDESFKHPTIDSMNKALGVGKGRIHVHEGLDEETAKYGEGLSTRDPDLSSRDSNVNFKEACKKAVEYITKDADGYIHFELDKLDVAAVVTKKFDSITGSELRKIFREVVRDEWAKKHDQERESRLDLSKIIFYMRGNKVPPPWEQEPELWQEYKERRMRVRDKHFGI